MTAEPTQPAPVPFGDHRPNVRLALRRSEAAEAIGVSDEAFDRHVRPSLPVVRCGTLRLYPIAELAAWLEARSESPMDELGIG